MGLRREGGMAMARLVVEVHDVWGSGERGAPMARLMVEVRWRQQGWRWDGRHGGDEGGEGRRGERC